MDAVGPDESRYYWIRNVTTAGVAGHYNSADGTFAETAADVEYLSWSVSYGNYIERVARRFKHSYWQPS